MLSWTSVQLRFQAPLCPPCTFNFCQFTPLTTCSSVNAVILDAPRILANEIFTDRWKIELMCGLCCLFGFFFLITKLKCILIFLGRGWEWLNKKEVGGRGLRKASFSHQWLGQGILECRAAHIAAWILCRSLPLWLKVVWIFGFWRKCFTVPVDF